MSHLPLVVCESMSKPLSASITLPEGKSVEALMMDVQAATRAHYEKLGVEYAWNEATMDGSLVVSAAGKRWRHKWALDGSAVKIEDEREEVTPVVTYERVTAAVLTMEVFASAKATPRKLEVRVIGTGPGENVERAGRWFVPATDDGIGSAVKVFGGARVHWHAADGKTYDHVDDKDLSDWLGSKHDVGYLSDLRVTEDGLYASLHLDADTPDFVREALVEKKVGLSVEAAAERRPVVRDGQRFVELVNWRHPEGEQASVAIVSHPALRGEVLRIAASRKEKTPMPDTVDPVAEAKAVLASVQTEKAKLAVVRKVGEAKLPELHAERVIASVNRLVDLDPTLRDAKLETEIAAAIESERKIIPAPTVNASGSRVEVGAGPGDKLELRLETLFSRNDPEWRKANIAKVMGGKTLEERRRSAGLPGREVEGSALRLFREATGHDFSDLQRSSRAAAVRASITSSTFNDAWENVLNRRFIASFENPDYSDWRKMCRVVPLQNFVKNERIIKGGYANLSTVSEGSNYPAMTSPADQGHGYTPTKRGGTEEVTWEAWLRDDVGALDVGPALGLAAARTLYEFVFDLYKSGTVTMDYDSTACYHADHGNLGSTALSSTELIAAYKAMLKRADISNSKRMMVTPKYLLVPIDLMNTAFDLLKSLSTFPGGSTADYEFVRKMALEAIVVRHWADTNDWYLSADPFAYPAAEVGFIGGMEEPEIFTQDDRNIGSYFNADKITYKVRHAYGGTILRHESVYGEVVA